MSNYKPTKGLKGAELAREEREAAMLYSSKRKLWEEANSLYTRVRPSNRLITQSRLQIQQREKMPGTNKRSAPANEVEALQAAKEKESARQGEQKKRKNAMLETIKSDQQLRARALALSEQRTVALQQIANNQNAALIASLYQQHGDQLPRVLSEISRLSGVSLVPERNPPPAAAGAPLPLPDHSADEADGADGADEV